MKVVYCAVADSQGKGAKVQSLSQAVIKQMSFSFSAAKYMLSSKSASDQYGGLRANIDVAYIKNVWDLLEDPITNFFATSFGFAPAMEKMKINCDLRIPVKAHQIFSVSLPQSSDDYVLKKKAKKKKRASILWEESPPSSDYQINLSNDSNNNDDDKKNDDHHDKKKKKKNTHNQQQPSSVISSSSSVMIKVENENDLYADKVYRIRCRYISEYASDVDSSLILKSLKSRANFIEDFIAEAPKKKRTNTFTPHDREATEGLLSFSSLLITHHHYQHVIPIFHSSSLSTLVCP